MVSWVLERPSRRSLEVAQCGSRQMLLPNTNKLQNLFVAVVRPSSHIMANTGLGVPVKLLHESLGHIITVELKTGQLYRGKLAEGATDSFILHLMFETDLHS
jgi:hypothetical protein